MTNTPLELTHIDSKGNANMVDVGHKSVTQRTAVASGWVIFPQSIYDMLKAANGRMKKGVITDIAHIAGIMGAKKTHELIPLCHALPLDKVNLEFNYDDQKAGICITATAKVTYKTGVEMEALTAVSIAALTLYDMTKALSHDIIITQIQLLSKTGGKQDYLRS